MSIFRESSQRKAIMANLTQRYDHPAAAMVYEDLKRKLPNLSLGTVYRNLEILERQGRVRSLSLDSRETRYDAHLHMHGHFICRQCGKIEDIQLEPGCCRQQQMLVDQGFAIEKVHVDLFGLCPDCRRQANQ